MHASVSSPPSEAADYSTDLVSASAIPVYASGDNDDYLSFVTTGGRPALIANGSYLVLGADGTPVIATTPGDVFVRQTFESQGGIGLRDDTVIYLGTGTDIWLDYNGQDTNAMAFQISFNIIDTAVDVPVVQIGKDLGFTNLGLFDGITQPIITTIEKTGQLHTATNGIADAGAASAILKHVGGFTAAVVGDIVRITAGTLCTTGWYWITTVTSADQVTLDRNYTSGNTTNVTFVTYHNFPMIGADGVCLKCFDGAPGDANVEIDRDGWLQLDVSQANGRLYWRANNAFHYVDATAGLSLPKEERIDPTGHEFQVGDEVKLIVDRINDDGSFHAYPYWKG